MLIQGGQQIDAVIKQNPSDFSFCGDFLVATTFALSDGTGQPSTRRRIYP
jgi:hypothetical protein